MSYIKISQLTEETVSADNDIYPVVENSTGITKKVKNSTIAEYLRTLTQTLTNKTLTTPTITSPVINTSVSGTAVSTSATLNENSDTILASQKATKSYVDNSVAPIQDWRISEAATFVSADGSTGVFNIASDVTGKYSPGMRYKYTQDQALTAYWTFNSDSTSQVGSFNGTDTNMNYTAGKFSNAATFNGTTSKIVISDAASLKPTGEFTIGCWFKTGTTGAAKALFQSWSANTNYAGLQLYITSGNVLQFSVGKNTGTTAGTDLSNFIGTTTVTDNAFHYVVVSFRNNYCQIYLDGKLETSGYCLTPAYAATNYVRVGVLNSSGSDATFMNGQIDDLFLINGYALDEATIKAKYAAATAQGTGNITVQKYGIITAVGAYTGGVTPITIWGGTDYSLQNSTISSPYYATVSNPFGCPLKLLSNLLSYTELVATFSTASSSAVQLSNLSAKISVPDGGKRIRITAFLANITNTVGVTTPTCSIWDGTVGSGTQLTTSAITLANTNYFTNLNCSIVVTPAAGTKTYNVGFLSSAANNTNVVSSASTKSYILVEFI